MMLIIQTPIFYELPCNQSQTCMCLYKIQFLNHRMNIIYLVRQSQIKMGNICHSDDEGHQPSIAGSRIRNPKPVKNMPPSSYAYQVTQPQLNRNVQIALNDPKLHSNKKVDVQGKPFFFIPSKRAFYQGDFNENKLPHGFGIAIFEDDTYYEGEFRDGQAYDDEALIIFPNGGYYKGQVKNSSMNGQGVFTHKNVYTIEGVWRDGMPQGNAVERCNKQNTSYTGNFQNGFKNGPGTYTWDNGSSKYRGEFSRGLMHDKNGKIEAKGGIKYNGEFKNGKRQGRGAIQTQNGVLEGQFKRDEINGQGKFKWKDGKVYEGNFRKSMFEGKGKIIYPNGKVAEGEWEKNHNKFVSAIIG